MKKHLLLFTFIFSICWIPQITQATFCFVDADCPDGGICSESNYCESNTQTPQTSQQPTPTYEKKTTSPQKTPSTGSTSSNGIDQRCWTKEKCEEARIDFGLSPKEATGCFYSAEEHQDAKLACGGTEDALGKKLGFCLPVGQSVTTISFDGKREFGNIAEFIQYTYKYGFGVGIILGIVMIIIGGLFQFRCRPACSYIKTSFICGFCIELSQNNKIVFLSKKRIINKFRIINSTLTD